MPNTIPTPGFGFQRLNPKSLLPGIFGYNKPKKQKKKESITQAEFSEMYYQLRLSLTNQGASESEIETALRDLESRVTISDSPSGDRSTKDTIQRRHRQIQSMGK
jgi:molybdopterin-biosynthesis enzyme MoeA-like protein